MSEANLRLGEHDFLVFPRAVHIMRYVGRDDEGQRGWRLACGAHFTPDTWDGGGYSPSIEEVEEHELAVCRNCVRTSPRQ